MTNGTARARSMATGCTGSLANTQPVCQNARGANFHHVHHNPLTAKTRHNGKRARGRLFCHLAIWRASSWSRRRRRSIEWPTQVDAKAPTRLHKHANW